MTPQIPTWTPERVTHLGELFTAGFSTAEIGRRMGITKNAVIGRLNRTGLTRRTPEALAPESYNPFAGIGRNDCVWPLGQPLEPGFRFCGARALFERPYCAEHAALAYIAPKDG